MTPDIQNLVQKFTFKGRYLDANPYGVGHINDTYMAEFQINGKTEKYILQRINHHVFRDPEGLMSNIEAVTQHLRQKIKMAGGNPERETLTLIPTTEGSSYLRTEEGDYWRGYIFINDARTYESVEKIEHVYHAAKAFGNFQKLLIDYPSEKIIETIPDFHNTKKRFDTLLEAINTDEFERAEKSQQEIEFALARRNQVSVLVDKLQSGELPERITHNDTKFNNVLIDNLSGEGVCVIDLDTVMPGLALYDYGDAIRSLANTASEDETDLSLVNFDLRIFDYFTRGYLESVGDVLSPQELEYLSFSAILMTFECGVRFLTDYLVGDTYYKIHRESHNLDRCRTQFKLVTDMEDQYGAMQNVVQKYC